MKYRYDDTDPDPDNGQAHVLVKQVADNYGCASMGCSRWPVKFIDPEVGIEQPHTPGNAGAYYEPAAHRLLVNSENPIVRCRVIDLHGRAIALGVPAIQSGTTYALPLGQGLARGVYVAEWVDGQGQVSRTKFFAGQ
jgi:hypothetical protein